MTTRRKDSIKRWACFLWVALGATAAAAEPFPWGPTSTETVEERFPTPVGMSRLEVADGSFGAWLRTLPVRPPGTPVRYFDGRVKPAKGVHAAVLDLDVGSRDLQQCADAVMRLRAEYLLAAGCGDEIAFDFTSGDRAAWAAWAEGQRPRVRGKTVEWRAAASADDSYAAFRRYLTTVFAYAGSASLARELEAVDPLRVEPGDVLIQGGFPGHAVLVLDVAETVAGERRFLLAQSYMPAQDVHVLNNPRDSGSAWYPAHSGGPLETPEWSFDYEDLRRFPRGGCRTAEAQPMQVGGDVVPPEKLEGNTVLDFRKSGCTSQGAGTGFLARLVIDRRGRIETFELLRAPDSECLRDYIRQTLTTWRFRPATLHGEPVSVHYHLTSTLHYR